MNSALAQARRLYHHYRHIGQTGVADDLHRLISQMEYEARGAQPLERTSEPPPPTEERHGGGL